MGSDECDVPWLRFWVRERDILLHNEGEFIFLRVAGSLRKFANMLTGDDVVENAKVGGGHFRDRDQEKNIEYKNLRMGPK